jgi:4-hydroxy-2-oxoheptanedioate aldolase
MVNSVEEAKQAVAACKYPPIGNRSVGGSQHAMHFKARPAEYFQQADEGILVVLQCEHIDAVRNADAIFGVEGIDAIFVGPNDLAASMRGPDGSAPTAEATAKAHADILAACQRQKVAPGFHAMNHHEAVKLLSDGWKFVAVASDLRFLGDGASEALKTVGLGTGEGMARY